MHKHAITHQLLADLFDESEIRKLTTFSELFVKMKNRSELHIVWEYDSSLGGLGGYAMPSNPVTNTFNTWGKDRNLFRSVQYAKDGLVNYPQNPRAVIVDVGRSLEITCKYIIDRHSWLSRLQNKEMLGRNLRILYEKNVIDSDLYETCRLLATLTNIAKHDINEREVRTFSVLDGVVAYFALRRIHNKLLSTINHPTLGHEYAIYIDKEPYI